jgi:hypothetical protein
MSKPGLFGRLWGKKDSEAAKVEPEALGHAAEAVSLEIVGRRRGAGFR